MSFVDHPLIKRGSLESRVYQQVIAANASRGNTLVVIPTGLGKTSIAILVIAHRLHKKGGKVLFLAPTRPLAIQHHKKLVEVLNINESEIVLLTGRIPPSKRTSLWQGGKVIVSTPQVVQNDIVSGRVTLENFTLIVFDEAHRAVGSYPYVFIAEHYMRTAKDPLILGLTASPGSTKESVREVLRNLFIKKVEYRSRDSPDVLPYLASLRVKVIKVALTEKERLALTVLREIVRDLVRRVNSHGRVMIGENPGLRNLIETQKVLLSEKAPGEIISLVTSLIKLVHLMDLIESQGPRMALRYIYKLKKSPSKANKTILEDARFRRIEELLSKASKEPPKKVVILADLLKRLVGEERKRVIIFCNYRSTVTEICGLLSNMGIKTGALLGRGRRGDEEGTITQEDQRHIIERFVSGDLDVLVSTSVGEEGLDLPDADVVILYDATPSGIRHIQRKGRVGRVRPGVVIALISEGREFSFYRIAKRREFLMKRMLEEVLMELRTEELKFEDSSRVSDRPKIRVVMDFREISSPVAKILASDDEILLETSKLDLGDYSVSEDLIIERKTVSDFVNSLVDGRLFEQAISMKNLYRRSVMIVEGESLITSRNVSEEAVYGAIAALIGMSVVVLRTRSPEETAKVIKALARREQLERKKSISLKKRPPSSEAEELINVLTSIRGVGIEIAKAILRRLGSLERVFTADEEELMEVEGVGKVLARRIRELATRRYSEDDL